MNEYNQRYTYNNVHSYYEYSHENNSVPPYDDIETLKDNISIFSDFTYNYVQIRKESILLVKTKSDFCHSMNVSDQQEALNLIQRLCEIVKIEWDPSDLTFTKGAKREGITKT